MEHRRPEQLTRNALYRIDSPPDAQVIANQRCVMNALLEYARHQDRDLQDLRLQVATLSAATGEQRVMATPRELETPARAGGSQTTPEQQVVAMANNKARELLALDLHDGVMQSVYAVALGLAVRERLLNSSALRAARLQIDALIEQVRESVAELLPQQYESPGIGEALEDLRQELLANHLLAPRPHVGDGCDKLSGAHGDASPVHGTRSAVQRNTPCRQL